MEQQQKASKGNDSEDNDDTLLQALGFQKLREARAAQLLRVCI